VSFGVFCGEAAIMQAVTGLSSLGWLVTGCQAHSMSVTAGTREYEIQRPVHLGDPDCHQTAMTAGERKGLLDGNVPTLPAQDALHTRFNEQHQGSQKSDTL